MANEKKTVASDEEQLSLCWQYTAYLALSFLVLVFVLVLHSSADVYFHRFLGEINPVVVVGTVSGLGVAALWSLQSGYGFIILRGGKRTLQGIGLSAILATALAFAIIIADFIIRYPEEMNVAIPQGLLFYPAIGFVAEIVFHLLPLALLLTVLKPLVGYLRKEQIIWFGILFVGVSEPTFQVMFEGEGFTWGAAYTWVHVFVIALLQLYVYRRFDFISMYLFRLFYYSYWHILWGTLRRDVLF